MIPSLVGRLQTRAFVMVTVALLWTLFIAAFLPRPSVDGEVVSRGDVYTTALLALLVVAVAGLVLWEPLYHVLQQLRWEKDWPSLFVLLTGIPEGILAAVVLAWIGRPVGWAYAIHFTTTWLVIWLFLIGPIRVVVLRWRYRGGRVL